MRENPTSLKDHVGITPDELETIFFLMFSIICYMLFILILKDTNLRTEDE